MNYTLCFICLYKVSKSSLYNLTLLTSLAFGLGDWASQSHPTRKLQEKAAVRAKRTLSNCLYSSSDGQSSLIPNNHTPLTGLHHLKHLGKMVKKVWGRFTACLTTHLITQSEKSISNCFVTHSIRIQVIKHTALHQTTWEAQRKPHSQLFSTNQGMQS